MVWVIDAFLQAEPAKWSSRFLTDGLGQAAMGLPPWAHDLVLSALRAFGPHWSIVNGGVVLLEAALGIGLMTGRVPRTFLAASIGWSLAIWAIGEGFGFLPSGQALLLGAPAPLLSTESSASWRGPGGT